MKINITRIFFMVDLYEKSIIKKQSKSPKSGFICFYCKCERVDFPNFHTEKWEKYEKYSFSLK